MIYLDNSATTRVIKPALDAACKYMGMEYYNPSALYAPAAGVEKAVEGARARLAACFGALPEEVYYTSGATESNNIAILGTASARGRGLHKFITTAYEHPSVYDVFMALKKAGQNVVILNVDKYGAVDCEQLESELDDSVALVSVMQVNNEIGALNDIGCIRRTVKSKAPNAVLHSDGVQAFGKLPMTTVQADVYSISGHKLHAPKGVGAIMVRKGVKNSGGAIGGGQERGFRSGTLNAPGIMALDAAVCCMRDDQAAHEAQLRALKRRLYENLMTIDCALLNGPDLEGPNAPQILNISFMGVRGEVLLHSLEERGVLVSTGSACSSHKKGKNRVLDAIGVTGERQEGAVRFSLSPLNTAAEMDEAAQAVKDCVQQLRRFRRR